jgi:hypothetical protein
VIRGARYLLDRAKRPRGLAAVLPWCVAVAFAAGPRAGSAAADSTFTWTGQGASPDWSASGNWTPGLPTSGPTELSFGALSGCAAPDTCYKATNDVNGLAVDSISIGAPQPYIITGNALTLGAGGLTAGGGAAADLLTPLTLAASQTWNVTGDLNAAALTGTGSALTVDFHPSGTSLSTDGDSELGPVTLSGRGQFNLDQASLNATDGNGITLSGGAQLFMQGSDSTGPITSTGGLLELYTSALTVNGGVSLNGFDRFGAIITGPAAGDVGHLTATGNVALAGSFELDQGSTAPGNPPCPALPVGTVYTLISTTGALAGEFTGVPNGAMLSTDAVCQRGTGLSTLARINYTPTSVTATIVGAPTVAQLRTAVSKALKPRGRNARIGKLLAHGGYTFTLPPLAGFLQVEWTAKVHGKKLPIASVSLKATGAGPTRFKVKLKPAGRRLLKKVASLKVTSEAVFAPLASAFVAIRPHAAFTLKR